MWVFMPKYHWLLLLRLAHLQAPLLILVLGRADGGVHDGAGDHLQSVLLNGIRQSDQTAGRRGRAIQAGG